jgi:sugar phosphate isomerase/epimerase
MSRKWSLQIKFDERPLHELFEFASVNGLDMIELRAPTRNGTTVEATDVMEDPKVRREIEALHRSFGLDLAYHAPQGELWNFGKLPFDRAVRKLQECIRRAASIGARYLTIHLGVDESYQRRFSRRRAAGVLEATAAYAKDLGIMLCVENLFKPHLVAGVQDATEVFEIVHSSSVGLTLDTGHANLNSCLHELVETFQERLAFTHISDNDGIKDSHLVPGNGSIKWKKLMSQFERIHYNGPFNFELRQECSIPAVISSLNEMLGGIR